MVRGVDDDGIFSDLRVCTQSSEYLSNLGVGPIHQAVVQLATLLKSAVVAAVDLDQLTIALKPEPRLVEGSSLSA